MCFRDRCCRVRQAAAIGPDQEIHPIVVNELCSQPLYVGAAAVIIIRDELERNGLTTLGNEEPSVRVRLLNPQTEPLECLLSLQRVYTGLRQSCANGKGDHERAIRKVV